MISEMKDACSDAQWRKDIDSKLQSKAYHEAHTPGVLATRVSSIGILHCNLRVQRSCCQRIFDEQAVLNVKTNNN